MVSDTGTCVKLDEPPDADPHVRWCERGRLAAAPYSIRDLLALPESCNARALPKTSEVSGEHQAMLRIAAQTTSEVCFHPQVSGR